MKNIQINKNDINKNIDKAFDAIDKWLASKECIQVLKRCNVLYREDVVPSYGYKIIQIQYHPDTFPNLGLHKILIHVCMADPSVQEGFGQIRFYYDYVREKLYWEDNECIIHSPHR